MKYTVRIADKSYEVKIEDINTRPIIAHADGERFEVHPENGAEPEEANERKAFHVKEMPKTVSPSSNVHELLTPLPGTIVEIFVKNGEEIEAGHVVLIIEAMKMKNSIRSTRWGKISEILVTVGQTVAHKQVLVRFK